MKRQNIYGKLFVNLFPDIFTHRGNDMNKNKEALMKYAGAYTEFKKTRKVGIERMNDVLLRLSEVIPEAEIQIKNIDDFSIEFQIFGLTIFVRFIVNVTKDIGCVQWFHFSLNPEKRKGEGKLILEYYFDYLGNIYRDLSNTSSTVYSFQTEFWSFVYQNLLEFCQKVDANTCSGFQRATGTGK